MRTQFRALLCSSRHRKNEGQKTWLREANQLTARLFLMHDLSAGRQSSRKTSTISDPPRMNLSCFVRKLPHPKHPSQMTCAPERDLITTRCTLVYDVFGRHAIVEKNHRVSDTRRTQPCVLYTLSCFARKLRLPKHPSQNT